MARARSRIVGRNRVGARVFEAIEPTVCHHCERVIHKGDRFTRTGDGYFNLLDACAACGGCTLADELPQYTAPGPLEYVVLDEWQDADFRLPFTTHCRACERLLTLAEPGKLSPCPHCGVGHRLPIWFGEFMKKGT